MTLTEARQILSAKPEFGSKPNPKLHRQAREVVHDWEVYRSFRHHSPILPGVAAILRKHPSFAREK